MGMFDYIRVHNSLLPLTDEEKSDIDGSDFQTKDLECYLNEYEITPDGSLILVNAMVGGWNYEERHQEVKYHGYLNFYTDGNSLKWYEFNAKFTDGKMVDIKQI